MSKIEINSKLRVWHITMLTKKKSLITKSRGGPGSIKKTPHLEKRGNSEMLQDHIMKI